MSGQRSALEVAREKRDAAAVEVAEAIRVQGRCDPLKFHAYTRTAQAFEQALKFERVAQALVSRQRSAVAS